MGWVYFEMGVEKLREVLVMFVLLDCLVIVLERVFLCFWLGEEMGGRFIPSYIDPVICLSLARV